MTNLIPEPSNDTRVVVETGTATDPFRLYWRDDAEANGRTDHNDERWFDDVDSDPLGWDVVCRNARRVYLVNGRPWHPLEQPEDQSRVAVRLIVEQVVRDVDYDRTEYDQAKAEDRLDHLVDMDVSDMDGDSVVIEVDGTEHRA